MAPRNFERQLTINVLTIAKAYVGQPEKADLYFQQSLLEDPAQPPEPEPPVPPVP